MKKLPFFTVTVFFLLFFTGGLISYAQNCSPTVPSFTVNLTGSPNGSWISPLVVRNSNCCGTSSPDRCVRFLITLDPSAQGIIFNIYSGAVPPGAMFYQINCGPPVKVGTSICLNGPGPHELTFCKPGNNQNEYIIQSIAPPSTISLNQNCTGLMYTFGYDKSSITWTSIYPGAQGAYNSYLSCVSGCDSTYVTAQPGFPPYVEYKVCGVPLNGCNTIPFCDTVRVYFNPTLTANISPSFPIVCTGGTTMITASPSGGTAPYTYLWNTGATSQSIQVSAGTYSVIVSDASSGCPPDTLSSITITTNPALIVSTSQNNVTCNSLCNGTASVNASGGTPGYSYSWSPPLTDTTNSVTGLCAGNYAVTITDTIGCSVIKPISITQPPDISISTIITNVSCNGGNNGSITTITSGGTSPYTYQWSTGSSSQNISGLPAGVYSVTVSDSNGCIKTASVTITEPPLLTTGSSTTNVSCYGGSNGTAIVNPSGGTLPYSYLWNPGNQTTQSIAGLTAGNYTCTVTDSSGCVISTSVTITQPGILTSSTSQTNVICNGNYDGSAQVSIAGGTGSYTYSWSSGATTQQSSNLQAGVYTVTVSDANGCTIMDTVNITQPPAIALSTSTVPTICTSSIGSASVSASGGIPAYTYLWSNGNTNQQITNLSAGIYSLTVTDANGCSATTFVSISSTQITLTINSTKTDVLCFGDNTGIITTTVTGGSTPYSYVWNNASTTTSISNLTSGTYSLIVTDTYGCTSTLSLGITQPPLLIANANVTSNVLCNGGNDGAASVNANGGIAPYTYNWSNGSTSQSASGLVAGSYSVTVTDNNGCTAVASVTITEPTPIGINVVANPTACNGGTSGISSIQISGGTTPYSYLWSTGATTPLVTGLPVGTHTLTVTDANGCQDTAHVQIVVLNPLFGNTSVIQNVSCNGGNDGIADVTAVGGTSPYTYSWNTGSTNQQISNLPIGIYSVTVTDNTGCTITANITITEPNILNAISNKLDVTCNGGTNGSASINASGGISPYNYSWSNGATNQVATNLTASTYTVTVTDDNGCSTTTSVTINEPPVLTVTITPTDASCNGFNNGSAIANANGGTSPYNYSWNTGVQAQQVNNLVAGIYTVTVTDNNGCIATETVSVGQPVVLSSTITSTDVLCFGQSNGTALANVSGGTSPYTYLWNGGQTTQNISGLPVGTFSCSIVDSQGCVTSVSINITQPTLLTASSTQSSLSCFGSGNGSAFANPSGGTPGYTYSWTNGQTNQSATGLAAGTYTCEVTDNNGCTTLTQIAVTQPALLTSTITQTNVSCFGGSNGTAASNPTGGTSPYTYSWNSGQSTSGITGLTAGTYTCTVTDNNGCTEIETVTITEPALLTSISTQTNVLCNGSNNGMATANPSGGTIAYTYLWSNGQTQPTATGLVAGTYSCAITDANGCTTSISVNITEPSPLTATGSQTNVSCNGGNNGTATASPSGGIAGYLYSWNIGQTSQSVSGLSAGNYSCRITDLNGCTTTLFITITQPSVLTATSSITNVSCNSGNDGKATALPSGGTTPYTYSWIFTGQTSATDSLLYAGNYICVITDANGCSTNLNVTITQPTPLDVTYTNTNLQCFGASNGTASVFPSGGTPGYSYSWSNGQTLQQISGLPSGTYTCVVTDLMGCDSAIVITITQPLAISANNITTDVLCNGGNNGSVASAPSGGTPGYSYLWSGGQTTQNLSSLIAGNYSFTITDSIGCTVNFTVTITEPPVIATNNSQTDILCNGDASGTATINPSGGTPAFTYLWSSGQTTQNISGLIAGTYTCQVTDLNNCLTTTTITITEPPALTPSGTTTNVTCFGNADGSAVANAAGGTPGYIYSWNNGQTSASISNLTAGAYVCTITDTNNCITSFTATITQPLLLEGDSLFNNVLCFGGNSASASVIASGGTPGYNYSWSSGQTTFAITNLTAGIYTCTVTDSNGCYFNIPVSITEPSLLKADSIKTDVTCNGGNDGTANANVSGGTLGYTYSWSNSQSILALSNLTAGVYNLTVTDANGCTAQTSVNITEPAVLQINISTGVGICNGVSTILTSSVSGGTPGYTYNWLPGGNTGTSITVSPTSTTTYTFETMDANGCTNSGVTTLTVFPLPVASFNAPDLCFGSPTIFTDQSTGSPSGWLWNFGDPASGINNTSTLQNPNHLYSSSGTYNVKLIITSNNNCIDSVTGNVTIYPVPTANFLADSVCFGDTTFFFDQSSISSGNIVSWQWDFSDPASGSNNQSSDRNPYHLFSSAGVYNVSLTVTSDNNCQSTITIPVTVNALPTAAFNLTNNCFNYPSAFTDASTLASQWQWNFGVPGATSTLQNPTYTYTNTGNYIVSLTVVTIAGCKDSITDTITVYPLPLANFISDSVCVYNPTTFTDLSTVSLGTITKWIWQYGDSTAIDTIQNPQHIFATPGVHTVTLTVITGNGCIGNITLPVLVYPQPVAQFTYTPVSTAELGDLIYFADKSYANIIHQYWNFGDSTFAVDEQNPYHLYKDTGLYMVTLYVENNYGCLDTAINPIRIELFSFFIPNAFTPNEDGTNDFFFGKGIGIVEYELYIFDRWGNLIYECNINGLPQSDPCVWNGKVQDGKSNQVVQEDVYVWLVRLKDVFGVKHKYVGHVTVVK